MTQFETIREAVKSERTLLIPLKEKVSSSLLKQQCQNALYYLDDCEHFLTEGSGLPTEQTLEWAKNLRKAVQDTVGKFGYNALETYSTSR